MKIGRRVISICWRHSPEFQRPSWKKETTWERVIPDVVHDLDWILVGGQSLYDCHRTIGFDIRHRRRIRGLAADIGMAACRWMSRARIWKGLLVVKVAHLQLFLDLSIHYSKGGQIYSSHDVLQQQIRIAGRLSCWPVMHIQHRRL